MNRPELSRFAVTRDTVLFGFNMTVGSACIDANPARSLSSIGNP
jgi:hypothetical protein